jgi:D-3-phosphoglycerate dehydrogenase
LAGQPVVLIGLGTFHDPGAVAEAFAGRAEIRYAPVSTPLLAAVASEGADAVVVASHPLTAEIIKALDGGVKVIGRTGVGVENVDLVAARDQGITVFNEPSYGENEVASHALAMLLALQRRLAVADAYVRAGWKGRPPLGAVLPLDEFTVGVVGCGRIGRATTTRLLALVGEVLVYDPFVHRVPEGARAIPSLAQLLPRCQAVIVHVPLTEATRGMLGRAELALLPTGAFMVNVARGGVVDEPAMAEMLHDGRLAGAGLDVFAEEPLPPGDPLLSTPNTILSPHIASYSGRSMWRLGTWTVGDAVSWVTERKLVHGSIVVAGTR